MKRRDFLKVLGVGSAGAATAGCSTAQVERLIPYVVPAEDIVPGVPTFYTSTCRECPAGCGIHVETHSGRATKVEGNPDHPISHGNLCPRGQASVQGLYHPDRYQGPTAIEPGVRTTSIGWNTAETMLADRVRDLQGAGRANRIVFLTGDYTGSMDRLANEFVAAIGARRVVYDPFADLPRTHRFADADLLVSFGADFLETWGSPVDYAWQFAQMHSYRQGRRGKFVWVGPHRPLTGLNADQWIAPKPGTEALVALALAGRVDAATAAQQTEVPQATLEQLASEFRAGRGYALGPGVALGSQNSAQLRDAIAALNGGGAAAAPRTSSAEVAQLVEQMRRGEVEMLLIDAPNPAYTLPGALGFAQALEKVPTRVSFSSFPDETSQLCNVVLPDHHFLEKWDDYVPAPGVYELVQPAMRPVFNTKQLGDVLLSVARQAGAALPTTATTYYDYLRTAWAGISGGGDGWRDAVKRGGVFPQTGAAGLAPLSAPAAAGAVAAAAAPAVAPAAPVPAQPAPSAPGAYQPLAFEGAQDAAFHLVVYPSIRFFDGRTANRPWLLELPDPVTKVSWSSWVELHPEAATQLGVEQGDLVEVKSPHGSVTAPAYVYPGVRRDTVAIQMGLGHKAFGRYTEKRGVNPNVLLGTAVDPVTGGFAAYGIKVSVRATGAKAGDTQGIIMPGEGLFEAGSRTQADREVAKAISLAALVRADQAGQGEIPGAEEHLQQLRGYGGFAPVELSQDPAQYPPPETHYGEYIEGATRWGMVVDLSRCIGCSACVTACYAENNIPVVGPTEVKKGRDLSWLRIERYWGTTREEGDGYREGDTNDTRFLPMLCQHCGNAPCEPVCPVYAAYHTPDGLNGQVYNRCVGTRYCANNCPYKVRVFNWWTYEFAEPLNWQLNPDVVVRDKGVMEKCTFCVQRIREGERNAAMQNRPVRDGEVVPACVQTCPTEVFVFGNFQDPDSAVSRAARSNRSYTVLGELNTQPAIVYLKKVTLEEPAHTGHEAPAGAGFDTAQETH